MILKLCVCVWWRFCRCCACLMDISCCVLFLCAFLYVFGVDASTLFGVVVKLSCCCVYFIAIV